MGKLYQPDNDGMSCSGLLHPVWYFTELSLHFPNAQVQKKKAENEVSGLCVAGESGNKHAIGEEYYNIKGRVYDQLFEKSQNFPVSLDTCEY